MSTGEIEMSIETKNENYKSGVRHYAGCENFKWHGKGRSLNLGSSRPIMCAACGTGHASYLGPIFDTNILVDFDYASAITPVGASSPGAGNPVFLVAININIVALESLGCQQGAAGISQ